MQTNTFFSFYRFARFAKHNLILNYRQLLMIWGALIVTIFFFCLFVIADDSSSWNASQLWQFPYAMVFLGAGMIISGMAFSSFRSKERTLAALMIPVSAIERLLYELIEKVMLYVAMYPFVFYLFSNLAVWVRNAIDPNTQVKTNGEVTFPFQYLSFSNLWENHEGYFMVLGLGILAFLMAFAGAAVFRKYPLLKTILFFGGVVLVAIGYFYFLFGILRIDQPWFADIIDQWEITINNLPYFLSAILVPMGLIILTYSYFKLKEKEVR